MLRLIACLAAAFPIFAAAQGLIVSTADQKVQVDIIDSNIVRVTNSRPGQKVPATDLLVQDKKSEKVTKVTNRPGVLSETGLTAILDPSGTVIIQSAGHNPIVGSLPTLLPDGKQEVTLFTSKPGSFYGAGERGHSLNLLGDTLVMYNRQNYGYTGTDPRISQMNITMPLVLSSDGYAILFDDYAAASLILTEQGEIKYLTESADPITYYYIQPAEGKDLNATVEALSAVTGRQPLPPLWSLGYITSKYGYHNEKETLGAIDSLKRRGYPVDGIVLDLYWYGKEQDMGRLAWEPAQWPNPEKMLKQLKKDNVNLVAISQPYVLRNGKALNNYEYLASQGMLVADSTGQAPQEVKIWVGEGGMLDVSNPDTRKWLAEQYKALTDMGITGWWGDLGEPEVHPETGLHANGKTARLYHNKYGNDWSKIISDLFEEQYPDRRLLTMMRGGTTGLQRYSVFPWSTDVSRSWGGLQPQITIMLNSGLSGMGYMGHDVGGFAVDPANPTDPELYVRWLQLGLFSPMLRTHAQHMAEPYHYPQYNDLLLSIIKERYRWLPYNYTLAYENATKGYPLVRPLNFYDSSNTALDSIADEFLWGSEVLVAPVITQGASSRQVVFPAGKWVDMANPSKVYEGGSVITYPAPLEVIPLFARAGAIIPMADYKMKSTADYNPANLTINYYSVPGVATAYTMYDDNRVSPKALDNKEYRLINFKADTQADGTVTMTIDSQGTYPGAAKAISLDVRFYGAEGPFLTTGVTSGSAKFYRLADGTWAAKLKFIPGTPVTITLKK